MIEEFKVNSKVDSGQLNLAHLARNKNNIRKETKTNASPHDLVQTKSKIRESSPFDEFDDTLFRCCTEHPTLFTTPDRRLSQNWISKLITTLQIVICTLAVIDMTLKRTSDFK